MDTGVFYKICVNHDKCVRKLQNNKLSTWIVRRHVSLNICSPTHYFSTQWTLACGWSNLFLYRDNKQQIQATIRMQERTESRPALLLAETVRSAGMIKTQEEKRWTREGREARWRNHWIEWVEHLQIDALYIF